MGIFSRKKEQAPQLAACEQVAEQLFEISGSIGDDGWDWLIFLDGQVVGMAKAPLGFWHDDESDCEYDIVGESHYLPWLTKLQGLAEPGEREFNQPAILVRDATNEYDPNAVAATIGGRRVGYIRRDDAPRIAALLDDLAEREVLGLMVPARVGWGAGDRSSVIGVRLDLPDSVSDPDVTFEIRANTLG